MPLIHLAVVLAPAGEHRQGANPCRDAPAANLVKHRPDKDEVACMVGAILGIGDNDVEYRVASLVEERQIIRRSDDGVDFVLGQVVGVIQTPDEPESSPASPAESFGDRVADEAVGARYQDGLSTHCGPLSEPAGGQHTAAT